MSEPVFQKLNPLTIVVELQRFVKQFIFILAYGAYMLFTGNSSEEFGFELIAAGVGVLVVVPAILRYYSYGYSIHDGKLLVKSGIISKKLRTIPLDRIQNVNVKRDWLHRILGLVVLEIETAAGAQAEATISSLNEEQAHILQAQLLGQKATSYSRIAPRGEERLVLYKPSNYELFIVGASENRAGTMIAAVAGLGFFQPLMERWIGQQGDKVVEGAKHLGGDAVRLGLIGFLIFLLIGWLISIVVTFTKYYGFELSERDGKLKRSYGLINHFENTLPVKRIQTVHIDQNFIQRWLKICKMYAATAGGMAMASGAKEGQQQGHATIAPPLLTPVLRDEMRSHLLKATLPKFDLGNPDYKPVNKGTIWRHLRTGFWPAAIVGGGLWMAFYFTTKYSPEAVKSAPILKFTGLPVVAFFGLLALAAFSGWMYHRFMRWSESNSVIATKLGWLKTRWNYLPMTKIQLTEVRQTPAQRWFGLGTVMFHSAAPAFKITEVDDVKLSDAMDLAVRTHQKAGETHDSLFDGF